MISLLNFCREQPITLCCNFKSSGKQMSKDRFADLIRDDVKSLITGIMSHYNRMFNNFDKSYLGYVPMTIIAQSCLGSIAAMLILMKGVTFIQMVQLFISVAVCMIYNGAVISQQKHKLVFNILIVSFVLNSILIAVNVF